MAHANSLEAKNQIDKSGQSSSQRDTVFLSIIEEPGTRQDIAARLGFTINSVCGRVKELLDDGSIIESGTDRSSGRARAVLVSKC